MALAALAAALAPACAHFPYGEAARHCPVQLVPTDALPDLRVQQRLRTGAGDSARRIDTVAEKRGGRLVLVALTPAGTRGFSWVQEGSEAKLDAGVARWLGVDPKVALDALHRARLIGWNEGPLADGEHRLRHGEEERVDTWRGGRRVARRFAHPGGGPPAVRIEYRFRQPTGGGEGEEAGASDVPRWISIENDWCGYRARILTQAEEGLP